MKKKLFVLFFIFAGVGLIGLWWAFSKVKEAPSVKQLSTEKKVSQTMTVAELSQHSSSKDCFVAYKNEVFDVTWFIPQHEGGSQIISLCGQQADEFSRQHPGGSFDQPKIQAILRISKVGTLIQ